MNEDDEKKLNDALKKDGIVIVPDESKGDVLEGKKRAVTLIVVDDPDHHAVGLSVEWGEDGPPANWDMENLTETQMFTLVFMTHVEELLVRMKAHGSASPALRAVSEDNLEDIIKELNDLSDTDIH